MRNKEADPPPWPCRLVADPLPDTWRLAVVWRELRAISAPIDHCETVADWS